MSNQNREILTRNRNANQDDRASRDQEQRAAEPVHEEEQFDWNPSKGILDTSTFPARPGYVQRWVRTKLNGRDDPQNIVKKRNQGYKPRLKSTVPDSDYLPTVKMDGNDVIGVDGMVLMERPVHVHERHAAYNREQSQRQMAAVQSNLADAHEVGNSGFGAPRLQNDSDVSTGRRAPVMDD